MEKFTCTINIMCADDDPDVIHAELTFQPHWWELEARIKEDSMNWPRSYLVGVGVMNFLEQVGRITIVNKDAPPEGQDSGDGTESAQETNLGE